MRKPIRRAAVAAGLLTLAVGSASPAWASGGSGGGGTNSGGVNSGGGGTTTTTTTTTTKADSICVQINSLTTAADQSVVTEDAYLLANYTVSRCGGSTDGLTVTTTATDADGNRALSTTDTWVPNKSLPFSASHATDSAGFGRTYAVTLTVTDPLSGAVLASTTRPATTPDARVASCSTVSNLGGTAGYYPGSTTAGALWLSDTVRNCGGREWLDTDLRVTDLSTGQVRSYPNSTVVAGNGTTGYNLLDVEPVPTGTPYSVEVTVRKHSTGELLDDRSLALATPVAR
jgi:hypothetical protein